MTAAQQGLPEWLRPVVDAAASITVHDLTRFLPPDDADPRQGAVLMLFGEGERGPDLLLTERAHHMRSHPGQVSFPGGSIDPGETPSEAAVREAVEETGLDASGVDIFAELPQLWLPPSNWAVSPVLAWWREPSPVKPISRDEVHAVYRVPLRVLCEPEHRIAVRHPSGWIGPGFLIGDENNIICWGFTAGIISRFFEFLGWAEAIADPPVHDLPEYMLQGRDARSSIVPPQNTEFVEQTWERGPQE